MLVTDQFVYIHAPKTGGTFVTEVLFRIYEATWGPTRLLEYHLFRRNIFRHHKYGRFIHRFPKHASVSEIPSEYANLAVISTVRDSLDLLVSEYEFKWWQRKEYLPYYRVTPMWQVISSSFPNLSFSDFLSLMRQAFLPKPWLDAGLGYALFTFVRHYCRDSKDVIESLPTIESHEDRLSRIRESVKSINFLSTAQLNIELYALLGRFAYSPDDLQFILDKRRVHPLGRGRSASQTIDQYFTDDLRDSTLKQERLLVDLLPTICGVGKTLVD
ncbi:MAG: hypothetical protein ACKOOC_03770 [Cyanobium sp.]